MRYGSVRGKTRALLKLVPVPWDVDVFVSRLAQLRDRPIRLVDLNFSDEGGVSGAWKATDREDVIFVASGASGLRREAIICHEIAHIFLGHTPAELGFTGQRAVDIVMPMMLEASPALAEKFMLRHAYDNAAENEAEHLATLILSAATELPVDATERHVNEFLR